MSDTHRNSEQYQLRLPDGLRDKIKASAEAEGRSMNSEIVLILQRYYASKEEDQ